MTAAQSECQSSGLKESRTSRKTLVIAPLVTIAALAALFGLMVLANVATQKVSANEDMLTDANGHPLQVSVAEVTSDKLWELATMPLGELAHVKGIFFTYNNSYGQHITAMYSVVGFECSQNVNTTVSAIVGNGYSVVIDGENEVGNFNMGAQGIFNLVSAEEGRRLQYFGHGYMLLSKGYGGYSRRPTRW